MVRDLFRSRVSVLALPSIVATAVNAAPAFPLITRARSPNATPRVQQLQTAAKQRHTRACWLASQMVHNKIKRECTHVEQLCFTYCSVSARTNRHVGMRRGRQPRCLAACYSMQHIKKAHSTRGGWGGEVGGRDARGRDAPVRHWLSLGVVVQLRCPL